MKEGLASFKRSLFKGFCDIIMRKRFRMKKNNLIPFSAVWLGLATFGILTLLIIFSHNLAVTITVLFLFVLLYLLLFVWQKKQYEKSEIEQIQYVNHQAENSLSTLLDQMPVGVLK